MCKKAISLFLVCCFLLQVASRVGILAYYRLNKDYISKVLCINKEKPKLHCEGQCFLAQKLKSQEEAEKKVPVNLKPLQEITLFFNSFLVILKKKTIVENIKSNSCYLLNSYTSDLSSLFHPPQS